MIFNQRYLTVCVLVTLVVLPIMLISSAIISPFGFTFNPLAEPLGIVLTIVIAILISLNLTVLFYNYEQKNMVKKKTTLIGGAVALFTTACPVCQPTAIVLLGFGSAVGFLSEISIYIAIASIAILLFSLFSSLKYSCEDCEVKNGKNN